MRIAVTGATGFVGSHLAEAFVARGHEVTVLARGTGKLRWISHLPVRVVYGSLESTESLRELASGADVVVHAAGITRATSFEEFLRVNVEGTLRVVGAALEASLPPRRFIYFSSQAALGPAPTEDPMPEDAELHPISWYGESKARAERALAQFADRISITVVRPPWVFGPRDRDTLAYFRTVARGLEPVVGANNRYSIVFARNLADGIALAAEGGRPGLRAYSFADELSWTTAELSAMMARAVGRRTLRVNLPVAAVAVAATGGELLAQVSGHPPLLGWRKLGETRHPFWVISDRRAREELGYRPRVSTEEGMRETAAWYREAGWL